MFEILIFISIIGVISATKLILEENKRRQKAKEKLQQFEKNNPRVKKESSLDDVL